VGGGGFGFWFSIEVPIENSLFTIRFTIGKRLVYNSVDNGRKFLYNEGVYYRK